MGEALYDLEQVLRSKKEQITSEETNILMTCKAQGVRDFFIGSLGASAVTWFASQRMNTLFRLNFTAGAGAAIGLWRFGRSLDSCVDHILSMEGTRIKNELAKIVLTKYHNDPSIMQRISRHFYSENVYDDSSIEKPKLRWRIRNYYGDHPDSQKMRTRDDDSYGHTTDKDMTDAEDTNLQPNQVQLNTNIDAMADPFDCVFGLPVAINEIHQPDASNKSPRRPTRSQRRSHRRHSKRHQDMSDA